MKKLFFLLLIGVFSLSNLKAQEKADEVLAKAFSQAKKEHKKVLLIFHASWCGWCKKMDKNMQLPEVAPYFSKNFVTTHLTVMEMPAKKSLENPGADEILKKYGGSEDQGIPFFVIINPKNEQMEENSLNEKKENLGCPSSPEEVDSFIKKLQKITKLAKDDEKNIREVFTAKK